MQCRSTYRAWRLIAVLHNDELSLVCVEDQFRRAVGSVVSFIEEPLKLIAMYCTGVEEDAGHSQKPSSV